MRLLSTAVVLLLFAVNVNPDDSSETTNGTCSLDETTCALDDEAGPWTGLLREWALTGTENSRHGRIMAVPQSKGYYVSDRIDLAPPPPPQSYHHSHSHPVPSHHNMRPVTPPGGRPYDEWQQTPPPTPGAGKIVNRPPNPYKDKFKPSPSYNPPSNQPIPVHNQPPQQRPQTVDRVDENKPSPQKQVSETDLYLLSAIEKLVYRADLMEKRVRKLEESVHYLVAGVDKKPEPCAENFTRVGGGCYHVSGEAANWKGANYACRRLKANMLELNTDVEKKHFTSAVLSDSKLKGDDFWTGGLNPGLLWIWSHSARPVVTNNTSASSNNTQMATIVGEGRCLAWVYDPAVNTYVYRGQDCALKHRYVCELEEDKAKLSNEIERVAKMLRQGRKGRKPKIIWTDEETR
ncbi:unnamed protein product [Arctia plantaginis]|uniref:C-type lectin domain-containing protein n=1 Tax=Arctia plantaginis TaxID=874455 RepID=A0A8S0Z497_ARCPL|nr:unnamed protein product [Arctia plantaginis]